ncbi:MAG: insulinase family protein [Burkholderiaceae bacterium]|nr:MAG: insulinase family protein [Burkholderiaceae bacterium]
MMKNSLSRRSGLILLCLCLPVAALAEGLSEFTLKNGLKIVVKEDHRAPTVAHMVWYRAGSMDEFNGTTGVAHVLEHMMFKGTKTLKPGEFSDRVAALGGQENAFTTQDYTAYYQQIHKSHLAKVMALEADRMHNLVIAPDEFAREMKVVMEERRWRTDDRAQSRLYETFMATAYQAHPYRVPTIGWMRDLETLTARDAQQWYQTWYTPANATLVVAGDVDPQQVLHLAQRYYGNIPSHPLPARRPQDEPAQAGQKRVEVKAPAENPYLLIGFKVPRLQNIEQDVEPYALEVLSGVLDGYPGARLNTALVRQQRSADQAGAGYDLLGRGPALFLLDGSPAAGKTTAALETALRAEVAKIASAGITEAELARVKTQLIASQVYKRDSIFGQAMEIGSYEMSGIGARNIDHVLGKLKAVTAQQVQAVAQKYFGDDAMTVAVLLPQPLDPNKVSAPPKGLHHQ